MSCASKPSFPSTSGPTLRSLPSLGGALRSWPTALRPVCARAADLERQQFPRGAGEFLPRDPESQRRGHRHGRRAHAHGARAEAWPAERLAGMGAFFSQIGYKPTSEWKEEHVFWDPLGASTVAGNTAPGRAGDRGDRPAAEARRTGRRGRARGAAEAARGLGRARRRFPTARRSRSPATAIRARSSPTG